MNAKKVEFVDTGEIGKRLDQIGWGIFLVMIGTIWLVPGVPQGTWMILRLEKQIAWPPTEQVLQIGQLKLPLL